MIRARKVVAEHVRYFGQWCPGALGNPHAAGDLIAVPPFLHAGPSIPVVRRVLCRSCAAERARQSPGAA